MKLDKFRTPCYTAGHYYEEWEGNKDKTRQLPGCANTLEPSGPTT